MPAAHISVLLSTLGVNCTSWHFSNPTRRKRIAESQKQKRRSFGANASSSRIHKILNSIRASSVDTPHPPRWNVLRQDVLEGQLWSALDSRTPRGFHSQIAH